ncbi:hypothetical protein BaRGS_00003392, partial [Batillaria attramentaria]
MVTADSQTACCVYFGAITDSTETQSNFDKGHSTRKRGALVDHQSLSGKTDRS